jgi:hypothetical protein
MIHGVCNILEPGPTQNEKNTNAGSSPTTMAMVVSAGPWMLVSFASYRESHHPIDEQRSGTMEEHRPELPQLLSWPHSESFYSTLEICTCNSPPLLSCYTRRMGDAAAQATQRGVQVGGLARQVAWKTDGSIQWHDGLAPATVLPRSSTKAAGSYSLLFHCDRADLFSICSSCT